MDEAARQEGVRQLRAGLAETLATLLIDCTAPLYWHATAGERAREPLDNGTVFFADLGAGPIGITAWHVVAGYAAAAEQRRDLVPQLGSIAFDPVERLIGRDVERDIATLRVARGEIAAAEKRAHTATKWPPSAPQPGKGIFLGGYPRPDRSPIRGGYEWGLAHGLETLYSVHEDQITIKFERERWACQEISRPPPIGFHWGGISGAPVFALFDGPLVTWQLSGVVKEFNSSMEVFYASSLSSVHPDGSITPSARRLTRACS